MHDLTFLIPVRIDTPDRLWNLDVVLRYLTTRLQSADVVVIESDAENRTKEILARYPSVSYLFIANPGRFCKADAANLGALSSRRGYVCVYDTDVLLHPQAISDALAAMDGQGWRISLPFNKVFIDVKGKLKHQVAASLDVDVLGRMKRLPPNDSPDMQSRFLSGGIVLAHRQTYLAFGGLNRKMISYGWEDIEVFKRFEKLGFPTLHLTDYSIIHLDHARGTDSRPNDRYDLNHEEYLKVCAMTGPEVEAYVARELSLTLLNDAAQLRRLRSQQLRAGLGKFFKLRSKWDLLTANVNAYGWIGFLRNRLQRS